MKLLFLVLPPTLALIVLFAGEPSNQAFALHPCDSPIFGDLSGNHEIDLIDAQLQKDWVHGKLIDFPCGPYDVDCDGSRTVADASRIKQAALGHPYHQNEPCPDIGTNLFPSCIDFDASFTCEPGFGPTPAPGPTPVDCIDFSGDASCGPLSRSGY